MSFSGGHVNGSGLLRALAVNPTFIICDEPISALECPIQPQVVKLFTDLKKNKAKLYLVYCT